MCSWQYQTIPSSSKLRFLTTVLLAAAQVGLLSCYWGSKVNSLGQWAVINCAALPTASAVQYATSNCKPLLFRFPYKWWCINVRTFNL